MFIASSIILIAAPFAGAEVNQTLTTQESLRSFERSPTWDGMRSINISPLNGVKPGSVIHLSYLVPSRSFGFSGISSTNSAF